MWINELKNFDVDRLGLDELVALRAAGRALQAEYLELGIEEPDWLTLNVKQLTREIKVQVSETIEKRKREIDARLDALKTPSEKRRELQAERAKLDKLDVQ